MQVKMTVFKICLINEIAVFIDKIDTLFVDFEFNIIENSVINVKKIAESFSAV